jgi:hypothetical protein
MVEALVVLSSRLFFFLIAMGFEKTIIQEGGFRALSRCDLNLLLGNGTTPRAGDTVTVHCTGFGKNRDLGVKVSRHLTKTAAN